MAMTKRRALQIIKGLILAYERGDSDDTLAYLLQQYLKGVNS